MKGSPCYSRWHLSKSIRIPTFYPCCIFPLSALLDAKRYQVFRLEDQTMPGLAEYALHTMPGLVEYRPPQISSYAPQCSTDYEPEEEPQPLFEQMNSSQEPQKHRTPSSIGLPNFRGKSLASFLKAAVGSKPLVTTRDNAESLRTPTPPVDITILEEQSSINSSAQGGSPSSPIEVIDSIADAYVAMPVRSTTGKSLPADVTKPTCSLNLVCYRSAASGCVSHQIRVARPARFKTVQHYRAVCTANPKMITTDDEFFYALREGYKKHMCG